MHDEEFERERKFNWRDWWTGFNWEETRQGVERESRGRILLLGLSRAGKSTLLNRLCGWTVSSVQTAPVANGPVEDFGLFCLLDLPEETDGGLAFQNRVPTEEFEFPQEPGPWELAEEADLLLYVLDGAAGVRAADYRWIGRLRRLGAPLVVVLNKSDLLGVDGLNNLPQIEDRLAISVLPVSALVGTNVLDRLLPKLADACPSLAVPLGRELRGFRRQAAARLIQRAAFFNGLISLEPLPLIDVPLQMLVLIGLVLRIATVYNRPPTDAHRREVVAAVAGGLAGRYAAQQAIKLLPVLGWLASGFIGMSCTWLLGRAAVAYFEAGGDAALSHGWDRLRAYLPGNRLSRRPNLPGTSGPELRTEEKDEKSRSQTWARRLALPWRRVRRRWQRLPRPRLHWTRPEGRMSGQMGWTPTDEPIPAATGRGGGNAAASTPGTAKTGRS